MNTQTHILLAGALFARPGRENRLANTAVLIGAFVPDALIFVMFVWSKFIGAPEAEVWNVWYFSPPWMTAIDWMNSIPLFLGVALPAYALRQRSPEFTRYTNALLLFALAALVHILGDLPFHVEDGHAHFIPFSQWRFASPVSYWDPRYFGNVVALIELALGLALITVLWSRFRSRSVLVLAVVAYAVPYVWFVLLGGHADHMTEAAHAFLQRITT
jgi:hypothetical protein